VAQLFYGPIADRFGRRPTLLLGLLVFEGATALCALAPSLDALLVGRVLQAVGGCAAAVVARAMIGDAYDRERAASVLGFVTMGVILAPTVSLVCGGYLVEHFGWRAGFVLLLVGGGVIAVASAWCLPETLRERPMAGLGAIVGGYRTLLRSPTFLGFALCMSLSTGAYYAFIAATPFIVVHVLNRSPSEYGASFLVISAGYMLGSLVAARVSARFGVDRMIIGGTAIALAGCAVMFGWASAGAIGMAALFVPMAVIIAGNGIAMPNAIAAAVSVEPRAAGTASGLVGFGQMAAGGLATTEVAWFGDGTVWPMILVIAGSTVFGTLAYAVAALGDRRATAARWVAVPLSSVD